MHGRLTIIGHEQDRYVLIYGIIIIHIHFFTSITLLKFQLEIFVESSRCLIYFNAQQLSFYSFLLFVLVHQLDDRIVKIFHMVRFFLLISFILPDGFKL